MSFQCWTSTPSSSGKARPQPGPSGVEYRQAMRFKGCKGLVLDTHTKPTHDALVSLVAARSYGSRAKPWGGQKC